METGQYTPQQPVPIAQKTFSPPAQAATQIAVGVTLAEVSIAFGSNRQVFDTSSGALATSPAVEWLVSMNLPLPTARNLRDALINVIAEYEKRFGQIPSDPNMNPMIVTRP
jgi:hypothetical protein